jgi:CyaY protein
VPHLAPRRRLLRTPTAPVDHRVVVPNAHAVDRSTFAEQSSRTLERLERGLGALEHDALDVQLAGDVLTLAFEDGARYVINAHSAAGQIWMAADLHAWHFDYLPERSVWIAAKSGDELFSTIERLVAKKLDTAVRL